MYKVYRWAQVWYPVSQQGCVTCENEATARNNPEEEKENSAEDGTSKASERPPSQTQQPQQTPHRSSLCDSGKVTNSETWLFCKNLSFSIKLYLKSVLRCTKEQEALRSFSDLYTTVEGEEGSPPGVQFLGFSFFFVYTNFVPRHCTAHFAAERRFIFIFFPLQRLGCCVS